MTLLSQAIIDTCAYSRSFGGRLTFEQLCQRLLSGSVFEKKNIKAEVKKLKIVLRKRIGSNCQKKINKAKRLAFELKSWNEIVFMGITGSVAAGYPKKEDDIDILLVIQNNRLWLTRIKLKWWLWRHKISHRSYKQPENGDSFCFNMWLEELTMLIPKNRQNVNNAVDMVMMIPLINRNLSYEKFVKTNSWAEKYVATGYVEINHKPACRTGRSQNTNYKPKKRKGNCIKEILNIICYAGQRAYMNGKIGRGEVGRHKAFFYP